MRSLEENGAAAHADSSHFNNNFANEPQAAFQEMADYWHKEMDEIQHMLAEVVPTTHFNSQGVGAGLTLIGIMLAVLIYVAYARLHGNKKSWVNSNVDLDGDHTPRYVLVIELVMYCLCSSLLLVINKVTITYIPLPGFVLFAQLAASVVFVKGMERTAGVEVDKLESKKIIPFIPVVMGFVLMLYTTMKALQFVPVDTFICARASIPTVIAIVEYFFLGRALPSARSWCALGGLILGVFMYVKFDYNFAAAGYTWIAIWYCVCVAEMVVVKHVCSTVQMTTWGRSYYMNVLALGPIIILGLLNGEVGSWVSIKWTPGAVGILLLSCLAGVGMSYYSFSLRAMISATSFSLVGNLCKVITILVNIVIWDKHAGMEGTLALMLCLAASGFYQQAPLRNPKHAAAR